MNFDADRHGNLALGLEGGHSVRRIVHAGGSATGRRITRELSARAATHERIQVLEPAAAVALWTHDGRCIGLLARRRDGAELPLLARATVLATGGMAALWERTTNPAGAVGAGLGLAEVAGARLADLEFMQFHPTALRTGGSRDGFLITEAVRGEGAKLLDADRRALRGRAGAARSRGPRDRGGAGAQRRAGGVARPQGHRPRTLSQHRRRARRGGHRPGPRAGARGPCRPLHDGRCGHRPRGARHAAGSLRGGRERLQRVARSQPAGLQLAGRVLRLRQARRGGGHSRAALPPRRPDPPPPPVRPACLRSPRARRCGATPGCSATPRAWRSWHGIRSRWRA